MLFPLFLILMSHYILFNLVLRAFSQEKRLGNEVAYCSILISDFLCNILFRVLIASGGVVLHWTPNLEVRSGYEPWPGSFCCVLGQEILLSQCLSPSRLAGVEEGQSTCDKNIILPIMTLLLTNDLPLFQPLVFCIISFLFQKEKKPSFVKRLNHE